MSRTIDQQVVEMQFDNQHFERNVSKSMSTLDKLKQSLNLTGASKGLENINAAAKNNNFGVLGNSVEAVRVKFSALQVMGVTALANITNSAVNAGKRITKALTIDPVKTGFQEYETQIGAIQTILANTESKGTTLEQVNAALDELNTYADKTIYNFTQMTKNIGTFTAAGIDLDKSVSAIKGIANLAAVSGSTSQQASTAMYQLSQALAAGTVKLQDWNSVVNAGMGGQVFQDALKRTATQMGYNVDALIEKYGSFRESLTRGEWVTSEVLTETLSQLAGAYSKADLIAQGYSESQAEEITKLAKTAEEAATKVKTFTQLMDTVKESVQSGWTQTWEILIGDFGEAKELFSGISDFLGDIISKISDARNNFLGNVFNSPWKKLNNTIEEAGLSTADFTANLKKVLEENGISVKKLEEKYESLSNAIKKGAVPIKHITTALKKLLGAEDDVKDSTKKVTTSVEDLGKIAKKVLSGEFGNGAERMKKLAEAGYNYAEVQNKVNEILGSSVRHTVKNTESQAEQIASLTKLSDAKLKDKGYTEEQIKALRELESAAEGTGQSYEELLNNMTKPSGRDLLIDSFKNIGKAIGDIIKTIGEAWTNVFGEKDKSKSGNWLYDLIEDFHELTTKLIASEESLKSFQSIVEGMFATTKIGTKIISKSLMSGLTLINAICTALGTDMLTVAGKIGDKIVQFSEWLTDKNLFGYNHIKHLADILIAVYDGLKKCVDAFLELEQVQTIITKFKETFQKLFGADTFGGIVDALSPEGIIKKIEKIFTQIESWIKKAKTTENLGKYIIEGLIQGMKIAVEGIFDAIVIVVDTVINTFKNLFGIHSPSTVMMVLGGFLIAGLIAGMIAKGGEIGTFIKDFGSLLLEGFKSMLTSVGDLISKIDFGKLVAVALSAGLIFVIKQLADALELFGSPLKALTGMFDGVKKAVTGVADALSGAIKLRSRVGAIKNMAIAIAILVGSIWLLSKIEPARIVGGIAALAVLGGIMIGLAVACEKLNDIGEFGLSSASIAAIALSLLALAAAFKILSTIDTDNLQGAIAGFAVISVGLIGILAALSQVTKTAEGTNYKGLGKVFTKLAFALLLMVGVVKLASMLTIGEIIKGTFAVALVTLLFRGIVSVCQGLDFRSVQQVGKLTRSLSVSLLLMVGVIKLASMLTVGEVLKGSAVIAAIGGLFAGFVYLTKYLDKDKTSSITAASSMMLKFSASLLLIAIVIKMVAGIDAEALGKSVAVVYAMGGLFAALIYISKFSGEHAHKAGLMLIEFSVAMLILTAVLIILKELDPEGIGKALGIMTGIAAIFAGLIAVTYFAKYADKVKGILISLTVAIGVMAIAIIAMSFLDQQKVATAATALGSVIGLFALLIYSTSYLSSGKKTWTRNLATIIVLAGVVAALSYVIKDLSELEPNKAVGAAKSLGILLVSLSGSLLLLSNSKSLARKNLTNMYMTIGILSLVIIALSGVISTMTGVDPASAISTAVAVGMLLLAMSASFNILAISKSISKAQLPKIAATMALLSGVVVVLGTVIKHMNGIDPASAIGSAVSIGILLTALSTSFNILAMSKSISKAKLPNMLITLAALTGVIAILGVVIAEISKCDPGKAIGNAIALSLLLGALTLMSIPLSVIGMNSTGIVKGALSLTAMVIPLIAFGYALSNLPDLTGTEASILVLTKVLAAMTLMMIPLTIIGYFAIGAIAGILALTAMVIPLATFAFALSKLPDLTASVANISLITGFMDVMTDILMKVTPLAPLALIGVVAIQALGGVVTAFGVLATGIGALMEKFPSLQSFLDTGISTLEQVSEGLGRVIGSFITGFANEVLEILPNIGTKLTEFMDNASGFIDGIKMVDESVLTGAKNLAGAILAISAAELINNYLSLTSLGTSTLANLGTDLSNFMTNAKPFFTAVAEMDESTVSSVGVLANALLALTSSQLIGAIANLLGADLDLGDFGTQLEKFGECIVAFNDSIKDAEINEETVKAAANAGLIMAELQKAIEPMGGVVQAFTGQKNLGDFGIQLESYGSALANFSKKVSAEGAINEEAITAAKNAGMIMTELQSAIEPTKGVWQWLTGDTVLDDFGTQLVAYGQAIVDFSDKISGENAINEEAITAAANAGKLLAEVQKSIPEDKWLDGKANLDQFGKKIAKFGEHIATYSDNLADVDGEIVSASTKWAKSLVTVAKSAAGIDTDKVGNFDKIEDIGDAMESYSDSVSDIDGSKVSSSISSANRLKNFINSLSDFDSSGVSNFKKAISSLGDADLNGVAEAFGKSLPKLTNIGSNMIGALVKGMKSKQSAITSVSVAVSTLMMKALTSKTAQFIKVGTVYMTNLVKGITSHRSKVTTAMTTIAKSGASSARGYYGSFYSAGSYLVTGFANGISQNSYKAAAKARAMANAAEKAAKEALGINSPSKVFMGFGSGVVEGFIKGIYDNTRDVVHASVDMADTARKGFSNAIGRVADVLNNDMDAQPTIRPVLDLSDVESGAATIGSMFGNPSVGVMSNLGAINTMMNRRNQNGANDDVVSAINKLGNLLGGNTGNTYQIDGITYNDDTPIADAVGALIRAITLEGRV